MTKSLKFKNTLFSFLLCAIAFLSQGCIDLHTFVPRVREIIKLGKGGAMEVEITSVGIADCGFLIPKMPTETYDNISSPNWWPEGLAIGFEIQQEDGKILLQKIIRAESFMHEWVFRGKMPKDENNPNLSKEPFFMDTEWPLEFYHHESHDSMLNAVHAKMPNGFFTVKYCPYPWPIKKNKAYTIRVKIISPIKTGEPIYFLIKEDIRIRENTTLD